MMAAHKSSSIRLGRWMCGQGFAATTVALLLCLTTCEVTVLAQRLMEHERIEEYHRRNHSWPPLGTDYIPNTPGWKREMERRLYQAHQQTSRGDRYQCYVNAVTAALTVPNFTESGWGLTKAPQVRAPFSKNEPIVLGVKEQRDSVACLSFGNPIFVVALEHQLIMYLFYSFVIFIFSFYAFDEQ
jgi:hypothetical protein